MMEQSPYPETRKDRKVGEGDKLLNPTRNQQEPGNDDGTECQKSRETNLGTLPRTKRNQAMMMEQNAKRLGRQAPEPYPEPDRTKKW